MHARFTKLKMKVCMYVMYMYVCGVVSDCDG